MVEHVSRFTAVGGQIAKDSDDCTGRALVFIERMIVCLQTAMNLVIRMVTSPHRLVMKAAVAKTAVG